MRTEAFTQRSLYTEELLHTRAFTHRSCYTQTLFRTESFNTQARLETETFTQRSLYRESFYTRKLSHTEVLHREISTQRSFHTQKLLHTKAFTQKSLHREALHAEAFTHRSVYTEKSFHRGACTRSGKLKNWQQFFRKTLRRSFREQAFPTCSKTCRSVTCPTGHQFHTGEVHCKRSVPYTCQTGSPSLLFQTCPSRQARPTAGLCSAPGRPRGFALPLLWSVWARLWHSVEQSSSSPQLYIFTSSSILLLALMVEWMSIHIFRYASMSLPSYRF